MISITLPDGSQRQFDHPVSVFDVASDIGPGLAKAALAGKVNGKLVDTSFTINEDAELAIVTARDEEGLEVIRHSSAHLLAQAVKRLYPDAQVTIGPVIQDGFFYDFSYPAGFSEEDLDRIEAEMARIVNDQLPVEREQMGRDEAVQFFSQMGEKYKAEIIASIPSSDPISLYRQGEFIDLCRGPHVPDTGKLKAVKLMKLAGAYWRGDSSNEMLQRIYGTAWANPKDLKAHLHRLEEAGKRDHRRLATQLGLFHMQEEAPGMVFWHDHGWRIWQEVEGYIRQRLRAENYQEIKTPQIVDRSLWEKSGHWEKFREHMFTTESESRDYAVKPMNCPCHVQVYNRNLHSYRDLPLRMAEFGSCHRNEPSGALHGLMRVRNFTQDDAHIFCTEAQVEAEVASFHDLVESVYQDFGFNEIIVRLSTRPEQRVGDEQQWDKAEAALAKVLTDKGVEYAVQPGEGAFYGPKIEYSLKDCLDRVWQCGTMQVDFSMPGRMGATYVDESSNKVVPVMLHRAILGSLERFIGILIEQYAGAMPLWLSPLHAVVMNITDKQADYCEIVRKTLGSQGFRVESDLRNEKIGFKIRERTLQKVPYLLVIGDREVETGAVAVRLRDGSDLGAMPLEAFCALLKEQTDSRQIALASH